MFCRNCGNQIPDNTKFCNHCGAAQESAPVQSAPSVQPAAPAPQPVAPTPTAAPKKNPMMLIVIAAVVVVAIVLGMFVIAPAMSGNKDQTPGGETSVVADDKNEQTPGNNDGNQEENQGKPSNENPVSKSMDFSFKTPDDSNYQNITLFYRDGSEYVSKIHGTVRVPKSDTQNFLDAQAQFATFKLKVSSSGVSEDLMWFDTNTVNTADGYAVANFAFEELDGSNADSVQMIAEFFGFPTADGYFKLSDCEKYLTEIQFVKN